MKVPRPGALRLVTTARLGKPPRPPLGLSQWTADATAAAVLLDAATLGPGDVAAVADQLPAATTLPPRTALVVFGVPSGGGGILGKLLGGGPAVSRAIRCGALIARGYVDVGAAVDEATKSEIAWGYSSA
jgi:hypothetical protein